MVTESQEFEPSLSVADILARWPALIPVFQSEGMGACLGCPVAAFESVAEAAVACRRNPAQIARALHSAMATVRPS